MPETTLPPGQTSTGVIRQAECAPGLGPVSVTATDCSTGIQLGVITPFTVTAVNDTQIGVSSNGVLVILCAAAGMKIKVGADNYKQTEYTLKTSDIQNEQVNVCLDKKESTPQTRPPNCMVHSLVRTEQFDPTSQALAPYYLVRDVAASTPRGAKLVSLYYDPQTKVRTFEAVQKSSELRVEGLSLVVELQPLLTRFTAATGSMPGQSIGCTCSVGDPTEPLLAPSVVRRASNFLDLLEEKSGAHELVALVREGLSTSERGVVGVVTWLQGDHAPARRRVSSPKSRRLRK